MNQLLERLLELKEKYFIEGVKQSFEDEGALLSDVILMRKLTSIAGLYMNVKIAGCEAKTDIFNCVDLHVDGIVAPMIESEFALQKFTESVVDIKNTNVYINIESKYAVIRLENIINHPGFKLLNGIIIGRSDLTKSFGLSKGDVDTPYINDIVENICSIVKPRGFKVGVGGSITNKSCSFIKKLHEQGYIDFIETRNMIVDINKDSILHIKKIIEECLMFEKLWLEYKVKRHEYFLKEYSERVNMLQNRLEF